MNFILIVIGALAVLGIVAALASRGGDDEVVVAAEGCAGCTGKEDCKLAELMEKRKEPCHQSSATTAREEV